MLAFKLVLLVGVTFSGVNGGTLTYAQQPSVLVKQVVQPEPYDAYPQYNYGYSIQDPITGDSKGQQESRDGDVVRGSYSIVEPDGTLRTVTYTAGKEGFNAVVSRQVGYSAATPIFAQAPRPVAQVPIQHFPVQQQFQFVPQQQFHVRPVRPALQPLPVRPRPVQVIHPVQQVIETPESVIVQQPQLPAPVPSAPELPQPQPQPIPVQPPQSAPQPIPVQPPQQQPQPVFPPQQPQQPEQPIQPAPQPQPLPVQPPQQPQPVFPPQQPQQPEPQPQPAPQPIQPQPIQPQPQPQLPPVQRPETEETQDAFIVNNISGRRADTGAGSGSSNGGSSFSVRSSRDGQYNYNFAY